ncbi:FAD/FMN-containing dehydrogenase/Fe-S oxidoreductase [Bradyrhizobium sp. USDA 4461]
MSHTLEIDHRKARGSQRRIERTPSGRITSEEVAPRPPGQYGDLGRELAGTVDGEVRFDAGSRALYATDASNYRQVPIGVVIPRSAAAVTTTLEICRKFDAPIVMRGGGTSLAGQGCNFAVLIDCSKYLNRVISIDEVSRIAEVEPGCILDNLRATAERHQLTFGPDPATHDHNTIGGMIGNNSCGVHSVIAGRTSDNVHSLDILTYDGVRLEVGPTSEEQFRQHLAAGGRRAEIFRQLDAFRGRYRDLILAKYPRIPRRVSGYENLDELMPERGFNVARALVGTEGTCAIVLRAGLNLMPSPGYRVLVIVGFEDIYLAADAVTDMLPYNPIGLEGIDRLLVEFVQRKHLHPENVKALPSGGGWLIAEFGTDTRDEATAKANPLAEEFRRRGHATKLVADHKEQAKIWEVREAALAATAHVPNFPESHPGWEDSAVRREDLGRYLRELKTLFHKHGYEASVYGHFGDGLIHCRVPFDLRTEAGLANWQRFLDEAADLVVRYGGSLSGEHGDGQARASLLEKMYGPELMQAFREFKAIWDPSGRMNPGKVIDPFPPTSNLRIGPNYQPPDVSTYFSYRDDHNSFAKATRRCVGVGACRRRDSNKSVMCPSYMATNEEKHSTRGRARLLFEMLHGGPIDDLWRSSEVEEALDLCLGCKGCKRDCPVQVDMATYKAEFRAHHYKGRMRPRAAYSMGLIHQWSRLASTMPWLVNTVLQSPGLSAAAKWAGGISPRRRIPSYARQSFVQWFQARGERTGSNRVMLWPDTFNNYFRPQTAIAATQVLEALGFTVTIPDKILCCGRPLYDWGMLDRAKTLWERTFASLAAATRAGMPIVGLEPACVSAFRDELPNLFPGHEHAGRLSRQMLYFTEFLDRHVSGEQLGRMSGAALVQLHCHHHAVLTPSAERHVLDHLGLDYQIMKSGCCGMAGAFGFERDKYDLSVTAAERALLPRIRNAPSGTSILANGFSCREQIEQCTGRKTMHVAELLANSTGVSRPVA